jgi:hypothetical protein
VLKNYRRYRDRYRKGIGDTTDIDTFIAILTTLVLGILIHAISYAPLGIQLLQCILSEHVHPGIHEASLAINVKVNAFR